MKYNLWVWESELDLHAIPHSRRDWGTEWNARTQHRVLTYKLLRRLGALNVNDCNKPPLSSSSVFSASDIWLGLPGWWPPDVRLCMYEASWLLLPNLGIHSWSRSSAQLSRSHRSRACQVIVILSLSSCFMWLAFTSRRFKKSESVYHGRAMHNAKTATKMKTREKKIYTEMEMGWARNSWDDRSAVEIYLRPSVGRWVSSIRTAPIQAWSVVRYSCDSVVCLFFIAHSQHGKSETALPCHRQRMHVVEMFWNS